MPSKTHEVTIGWRCLRKKTASLCQCCRTGTENSRSRHTSKSLFVLPGNLKILVLLVHTNPTLPDIKIIKSWPITYHHLFFSQQLSKKNKWYFHFTADLLLSGCTQCFWPPKVGSLLPSLSFQRHEHGGWWGAAMLPQGSKKNILKMVPSGKLR